MDNDLPVVLSKRGLDPEQVNVALGDVQVEVSRLESERAEIDKRIDSLTREIAEVRSALKRASAKPSFSDLGAAFEQTLRVAEEQAGKLIADAQAASSNTRKSAEADAASLTETAEKQALKAVADAESRVARLISESEKKFEDTLKVARANLAKAEAQHAEALQVAASISSEGEQKRANLEIDLAREIDQSRGEIDTLRQLHERDQRRISDEVDSARAKAERESTRLAAENETYIRHLLEDSQAQLDEARTRAREMVVEAQKNFGQARQDGVALVREARETAAGIVRRARARAQTLTERLEERNAVLLANGEQIVEDLSFEREAVEAFNSELRIISMSERATEGSDLPYDFDTAADHAFDDDIEATALGMLDEDVVRKTDGEG